MLASEPDREGVVLDNFVRFVSTAHVLGLGNISGNLCIILESDLHAMTLMATDLDPASQHTAHTDKD